MKLSKINFQYFLFNFFNLQVDVPQSFLELVNLVLAYFKEDKAAVYIMVRHLSFCVTLTYGILLWRVVNLTYI